MNNQDEFMGFKRAESQFLGNNEDGLNKRNIGNQKDEIQWSQIKTQSTIHNEIKQQSCYKVLFGILIIICLLIGLFLLTRQRPQDEQQELLFANTITKSLLKQLQDDKILNIEEQKIELKKFYDKKFSNSLWNKIVNIIEQNPNIQKQQNEQKKYEWIYIQN